MEGPVILACDQHQQKKKGTNMNQNEIDDLLWRAFYLGARVTQAARGEELHKNELPQIVGYLHPITANDLTLHNPTENAIGWDSETASCIISIGNKSILADREIARRVVRGFEATTEIKDDE